MNVLGNINIDGDIIPSKNEVYDLGSSSHKFRDLYLSGSSIQLGTKKIQISGDDINFDSLLVNNNLTVNKKVFVKDTIEVDNDSIFKGNIDVSGNINVNNDLIVKNKTIIKDTLTVTKGVQLNDHLVVEETSTLRKDVIVNEDMTVNKNLLVEKDSILKENVNVSGNVNVENGLVVNKESILKENVNVSGNVNVDNDLIVKNKAVIKDTLTVTKGVQLNDHLVVEKTSWLKDILIVEKGVELKSDLVVDKKSIFKENVDVSGNINVDNDLVVNKESILKRNVNISGNVNVNEGLIVNKGSILNDTLRVIKGVILNSDLVVDKKSTFKENVDVSGNINVYNDLVVDKETTLKENVNVLGNLNIKEGLILPNNKTNSVVGSVYYNKDNDKFYGFYGGNKNSWKNLGGIDDTEDTIIYHNLTVNRNINVLGNHVVNNDLIVKGNGIVEGNLNIKEGLILPNKKNNSVVGSVYYDKDDNKFFGYYGGNKDSWKNLGGIDDTEDTIIYHNLTVNRNTSISGNLVISNDILPLITDNSNIGSQSKKFNNIHAEHIYVGGNSLWIGDQNKIEIDSDNNLKFRKINKTKVPKTIYNKLSQLDNSNSLKLTSRNVSANLLSEINSILSSSVTITATTLNLVSDEDWIKVLKKKNIELDGGNSVENLYNIEDEEDEKSDLTGLNNVIINKNLNVLGNINIEEGLILPNNVGSTEGSLYIRYNSSSNENELKLTLNNIENSIFLNKGHLSHLTRSTDLFQFYNVYKNIVSYGNRITGLSDPQFTSFSKFYVLQEYIFNEEETIIDNVEFYISTSTSSSNIVSDLKISIVKMSATNTEETTVVNNINIADGNTIKGHTYLKSLSDLIFVKNDRIKIKLVSSNDSINGSEVFCRLVGTTKIYPVISNLNITGSSHSITDSHNNALRVNGGGYFGETLKAKSIHATNISSFTGCHISELSEMNIINDTLCELMNEKLVYREGLIVNVKDVLTVDISDSKFEVRLCDTFNEKKIFGVINSYLDNNDYLINSLGEGGIWVSNINGDIENGDYITSSSIPGIGCKQNCDMLHNYTVAKCCCNIDWDNITERIMYNNINYKIKFIACTYHCG